MTCIFRCDQIDARKHRQRPLGDITQITNRGWNDVERAGRNLCPIELFHCFIRIADLILSILKKTSLDTVCFLQKSFVIKQDALCLSFLLG